MKYFSLSNVGPRKENQDRFSIIERKERLLCCVADGVGGVEFGGIASEMVVESFKLLEGIPSFSELEIFIRKCHSELIKKSESELHGRAATTFTCGIISDKHIYGLHVGDSRASLIQNDKIILLTEIHTEAGRLNKKSSERDANYSFVRNTPIESVIGINGMLTTQRFFFEIRKKDRIILSTDGFHNIISNSDLLNLSQRNQNFDFFKTKLEIEIENRVLRDNLTAVVIEI